MCVWWLPGRGVAASSSWKIASLKVPSRRAFGTGQGLERDRDWSGIDCVYGNSFSFSFLLNENEQIPHEILVEAEHALDKAFGSSVPSRALCDVSRWIKASSTITHVSAVNVLLSPASYYLTTV